MHRALLLLLVASSSSSSIHGAESVILWKDLPPQRGLAIEERINLSLEGGKLSMEINNANLQGRASAEVLDRLQRVYKRDDEQLVTMLESSRSILFSFGGNASEPKLENGKLNGRKLVGTRENGGAWTFRLAAGEPGDAEKKALDQFTAYTQAIDGLGLIYGPNPHRVGDPWKPDLKALKKQPFPYQADLVCNVDRVVDHEGEKCAQVSVHGQMNGKVGDANTVDIRIEGTILRSLTHLIDLDTDLTGTFKFVGALAAQGNGPAATIEAPLKVKRTVKFVK